MFLPLLPPFFVHVVFEWYLPWIAHIKKASVGVSQLHTIRVINAWFEVEAKNNTGPTEYQELVIRSNSNSSNFFQRKKITLIDKI